MKHVGGNKQSLCGLVAFASGIEFAGQLRVTLISVFEWGKAFINSGNVVFLQNHTGLFIDNITEGGTNEF